MMATTCPYGTLEQHFNESANCELGEGCAFHPSNAKVCVKCGELLTDPQLPDQDERCESCADPD